MFECEKATGPDRISGKRLRFGSSQLASIYSVLFSWSLRDCSIPSIWKSSLITPLPNSRGPKISNDFRPVALTSIAIKTFERIFQQKPLEQTQHALDPHQFAYK